MRVPVLEHGYTGRMDFETDIFTALQEKRKGGVSRGAWKSSLAENAEGLRRGAGRVSRRDAKKGNAKKAKGLHAVRGRVGSRKTQKTRKKKDVRLSLTVDRRNLNWFCADDADERRRRYGSQKMQKGCGAVLAGVHAETQRKETQRRQRGFTRCVEEGARGKRRKRGRRRTTDYR